MGVIELKQWSTATLPAEDDENKEEALWTYVGGGHRRVKHPLAQARSYRKNYLKF